MKASAVKRICSCPRFWTDPNRTRGEFDYATVHSVKAIQAAGYEAIIMNSNPETVSTDFSISDKLYFEPLTLEDVLRDRFGTTHWGHRPIWRANGDQLAEPLVKAGVKILGTSIEDLDRAENRDLFEQALQALDISQPPGDTATNEQEAIAIAQEIGYPVLVRPSYVLGDVRWKSWKTKPI